MKNLLTRTDLLGVGAIVGLSAAGWLLGIRPVVQMKADQLLSAHELAAAERGAERFAGEADALKLRADALSGQFESERVTLELEPEALALFKAAKNEAVRRAGGRVDDSTFMMELISAFLDGGSARDAGKAAFQIALTVNETTA